MKKNSIDINASLADLMTGVLFLFIIALIAYMLNFNDKHSQENKLQSQLKDTNYLTSNLINNLSKLLDRNDISHTANVKAGSISFDSQSLAFESGGWELNTEQLERLESIQLALELLIPCYAKEPPSQSFFSFCKSYMSGKLEAIIIEGHTDNTPIRNKSFDNIDLSYRRAKSIYSELVSEQLMNLKNNKNHSLFSVLGAGDTNPINFYETPTADIKNRRIELRFVMEKPWI
ncbi:MAG: OmpA family protein [Marinomonas sp.]